MCMHVHVLVCTEPLGKCLKIEWCILEVEVKKVERSEDEEEPQLEVTSSERSFRLLASVRDTVLINS